MKSQITKKPYVMILIVSMTALAAMAGCTSTTTSTPTPTASPTPTPTQSQQNQQPIEVVSVLDTYTTGQTVNPGGPEIEITLKNVSNESVVSLAAALELLSIPANSGLRSSWNYDYDVTPSHPLLAGKSISAKNRLIGGGLDAYVVTINGTLQNGATFTYTWEPVEVVSVIGPVPPYNPGGPVVAITLKNAGEEPVTYLKVTLKLAADFEHIFDNVTPTNPLLPGASIDENLNLIGPNGNFASDISYPLTINVTLQNGNAVVYTKQVLIGSPPPSN
jgi:hypothetical protein